MSKPIIIICEDTNAGYEYFQRLNRYFRENDVGINFVAKKIGSGHFSVVKRKYTEEKKKNKNSNIIIVVDYDIYKRNEQKNLDKYNKKKGIPDFYFHYHNFEDFLIMHCKDEIFNHWYSICLKNNHFKTPMKSEIYLQLIKKNLFSYDKSELPKNFEINDETLKNLFKHNGKYKFKSDFAEFLEKQINHNKVKNSNIL